MVHFLRKSLFLSLLFIGSLATAQQVGDTIVVQALTYNSVGRDMVVSFPNLPNVSFEKIIMLYNMRCKDNKVSTGSNRNLGCGEWDYSCNTYITDSAHVDSNKAYQASHNISGFSGSTYNYTTVPTNAYYQQIHQNVTINSTTLETTTNVGTGILALPNIVQTTNLAGKTQLIFTQVELLASGLLAGNIRGINLAVASNSALAKGFRVRIKATSKTTVQANDPDLAGFTEVYSNNANFLVGSNRLQFYQPFLWDGLSNIIVELTYNNKNATPNINLMGDSLAANKTMTTAGDGYFTFNGSNYAEAIGYKGILGSGARTIEAWIKTTANGDEIISWGTDASGQKYLLRLDGSGKLRVEVNNGYAVGTAAVNDGQWHHVAAVQTGSNTNTINFYVDGNADPRSSTGAAAVNTTSGINVRVTKGHHNFYFEGEMGEIRVWNTALTQSQIAANRYKKIDATHPAYANLQLYYKMNENSGSTFVDASPNARNATLYNSLLWNSFSGINHFNQWEVSAKRPNISFYQGVYNLTVVADTLLDTIQNPYNIVKTYGIFPKSGTIYNDSIGITAQANYWEAVPEKIFDIAGIQIGTLPVTQTGNISITQLPYFKRAPSKFEIMSFVTPYGINLNLGATGKTWTFDVTDFSPILKGNKRLHMSRGGENQEQMDIKFLFIVGTPERDVLDIQQIWTVDKTSFANINANNYFEPRDVMMLPAGHYFKIRAMVTGHGQEGEFIPRTHQINLNGGPLEFSWQGWKTCGLNPIYPQGGTWVYDRAGWCPGMATDLHEFDITTNVTPGQITNIDYGVATATGTSDYIVNAQLVTYGSANHVLDAAINDIVTPSQKIEYSRESAICRGPVVEIRNTGSTPLTSATLTFWVNNASNKQSFNWSGNLGLAETQHVNLPTGTLWDDLLPSNNIFYVEISAPNGGTDAYANNNKMSTGFVIPEVVTADFYISFITNLAGYENAYQVIDENGNVVFARNTMASSTTYRDTLGLSAGCYTLKVTDTGGDGIAFWANNAGSGTLQFRSSITGSMIKSFQGDFGSEINYQFTINYPLTVEDVNPITATSVYPNPATNLVTVETPNLKDAKIKLCNSTGQHIVLPSIMHDGKLTFDTSSLAPGIYFIKIENGQSVSCHKVVIL